MWQQRGEDLLVPETERGTVMLLDRVRSRERQVMCECERERRE